MSCAREFQTEGKLCALGQKALARGRFGMVGPYKERAHH